MANPNWPAIRAGIFAGESGGDYDALFGFSNRPGGRFAGTRLRDMTIDQALAFADPSGPYGQWVKGQIGRVATPMGGYQIVGTTLREAKDALGLTGNEKMDEATQDRLGQWILARQGTGAWEGYRGPRDPGEVERRPLPDIDPYASMPDGPKGEEVYAQQPAAQPSLLDTVAQKLGLSITPEQAQAVQENRENLENGGQESLLNRLGRSLAQIESPAAPRLSGVQGASDAQIAALTNALKQRGSLAEFYKKRRGI